MEKSWLEWDKISKTTHWRYVERAAEIVSSVVAVIYPQNPESLWRELQSTNKINNILGKGSDSQPVDSVYLLALAEAFNTAGSWDTRRQILSVMAGVASFKEIVKYIPGLSKYRYTAANLHRLQFGPAAPVQHKPAPRLRIDQKQLDHFLGFITSPHLVQDLPFGKRNLKLSTGQLIEVPNVIRTMIPQRIVQQYTQYCKENDFVPLGERTMLRILSHCSASVRKSLQGLDYFAAEGGRAFDELVELLEFTLLHGANHSSVSQLQHRLKAAKLYLKGDFKVIFFIYCLTKRLDR